MNVVSIHTMRHRHGVGRPRSPDRMRAVSIRVPPSLRRELEVLAGDHGMTMTDYMRVIMSTAVKEQWRFAPTMAITGP